MGTYLNPGNKGFQKILQSEYVDKTGLIALVNKTVGTMGMLTCISRPRRFGKSYAAKMLCAYYDCSCDSHALFAMQDRKCRSYWKKTSAAESLLTYINMDFEGLQEIIARLIAGEEIEVRTGRFENDFETFKNRDDVLTLLIHLGYLTWNEEDEIAHIPNEEVRIVGL